MSIPRNHRLSMKTIVTSHPYPPIPLRSMDWQACFDGEEEDGPYGYGATEAEAIEDLKQWSATLEEARK